MRGPLPGRRLVAATLTLAALALASSASAAPYRSPGYKGTKSFAKVVPPPLAPIALGTGKNPNLLVDAAGTAHILFAQDGGAEAADTLAFCNLQRGIKTCASRGVTPNPTAPDPGEGGIFIGNSPGINDDNDGPVPLVVGNQLFVVDRRFPDFFHTPPGGESDSNVFLWSSVDGGATITGPGQIGDNQMSGGAIAFGDPAAPVIATISRTQTGGTTFQASPSGTYTTAKAQLGTGDQAYDGGLALDGERPIAAFADLSGTTFVREFSGTGDPNDVANWSQTSFPGYGPRIVGGAAGVFVLTSDSNINNGNLRLQRIVNGAPSGAPVTLGKSSSEPAISQDPTGRIAFAYTDATGLWVRSSDDGVEFSPPELVATIPAGQAIAALSIAATTDGGGFATFVRNPVGASAVGDLVVAAFGSQRATGKSGLGPLPGGGIGSAAGDELATSTCQTAKFGVVQASVTAGCFGHDPKNPNLDITLGELNLNGLRIIPDPGARIGVDPKRHTIDTTGKVRVVLSAADFDITIWHDELHVEVPDDGPGDTLFDFPESLKPLVKGFPIEGDINVKLAGDGADIPISLALPKYFGGVTGSATLHVSITGGLSLKSLEFKVGDVNLGALELKDLDVSYTLDGNAWKGSGELLIPAGGGALDAKIEVEFDDGTFVEGALDVGLPYPGIPLDASNPPPQLYFSHVGLKLRLQPPTFTGMAGFGLIPLKAPGTGSTEDYVFRLEGALSVAFGRPVTITATATGFLYNVELASAELTYRIPDQVTLVAKAKYRLGILKFEGDMGAIIDAKNKVYGASLDATAQLIMPNPFGDITLPGSFGIAINNAGFGGYVGPPGIYIPAPVPGAFFWGAITYHWGDDAPELHPFAGKSAIGEFKKGVPTAASARRRARSAAATSFEVPAGAPLASVVVHGTGGAPAVSLLGPDGNAVTIDNKDGAGEHAGSVSDSQSNTTSLGILNPRAGRWTVVEAPGSAASIASLDYAIGSPAPKLSAKVSGKGYDRTVSYRATVSGDVKVTLAEKTGTLLHEIATVKGKAGTIRFRPALGSAGRRQLIARITSDGVPFKDQTLASYTVPKPPKPGRAKALKIRATARKFSYSYTPPTNADRVLIKIAATDGRRLQSLVSPRTRKGSVPVIGFRDGITVTVTGIAADGRRGASVKAKVRRKT